jgi:broad specificity phosphatase PhoE
MYVLFYLVRHGKTTDSDKGIIRGDRNSMLNREGFLDAYELKDFFSDITWDNIHTSDMTRSEQTAKIIAGDRYNDITESIHDLRPWDVGYLTGLPKKEYAPDMTVFVENPDMRPQDGETRNEFFARVNPILLAFAEAGIQGKVGIVVGHSSIIHALAHLLWGEEHPPLAVKPGGVIEVFVNKKGEIDAREIFKKGKDDSSFGVQPPTS